MVVLRPIAMHDYDSLMVIAHESGHGFTSLPVNEALLRDKIEHSVASFAADVQSPGKESYLFVLEDLESGEVVGTSGIEAAVGLDDAFYHYHLGKVVHSSRELGIYNTVDILTLCNDYTGATEICTLFLREKARKNNNGKLLSKFRFPFMAEHNQRFSETVIAEMRGVSDEAGNSPFWKWLDQNFFSMDFPTADYLTGIGQKVFIAELMPKYPIYVNLLSEAAQKVIGRVHDKTRPAMQLLQSEGMSFKGYVDIFDAGPTVEGQLVNIRSARCSKQCRIESGQPENPKDLILLNTELEAFRGTLAKAEITEDAVIVEAPILDALNVKAGDKIRAVPL